MKKRERGRLGEVSDGKWRGEIKLGFWGRKSKVRIRVIRGKLEEERRDFWDPEKLRERKSWREKKRNEKKREQNLSQNNIIY